MDEMKMWFRPIKGITLCFAAALFCSQAMAQVEAKRSFSSAKRITAFDNTTFCTAFLSDGSLLTIRDIPIVDLRDVDKVAFNPTGSSLALMRGKKAVSIYSFRDRNKKLFELKEQRKSKELKGRKNLDFHVAGSAGAELMKNASKGDIVSVAMCYGADARNFIVSNSLGEIIIYDTKEYLPQAYIQGKSVATSLSMSPNNYFIAAGTGKNIDIWNFQTKELRKSIPMPAEVTEVVFSTDASQMAAVTTDKRLTIFDTKTWDKIDIFDKIGGTLTSPSFHPEGKYISVVKDGNSIVIMNLKNSVPEQTLNENPGGITASRFFCEQTDE